MENYQMMFLGSPAMANSRPHPFGHLHNGNNIVTNHGDHHDVLKFDLHHDMNDIKDNINPNNKKFGDHESGTSCRLEKNKMKSGTKKGDKVRKHKFAFQTRSQVDVLDDGYRWRKYGQKTVKNSRFPRSYYKCTYQGCNVKKQIQRLCKDEGIVVTTYEGMHTHSIEKSTTENFDLILKRMQTSYTSAL